MLAQTYFCKCLWSGSAPAGIPGLGLVLQKSLALVFSLRDLKLRCIWTHKGPGSNLLPQVSNSCLDLQKLLVPTYSLGGLRLTLRPTEVLAQAYFHIGPRLMFRPAVVSGSGSLAQQLLPSPFSCEVCCLRSATAQVVGSDLPPQMSLFWICFCSCGACCLRHAPA